MRLRRGYGYVPFVLGVLFFAFGPLRCATAQSCGNTGLAVQVLGSGGPDLRDKRASSSYLVWKEGKALVLIDAGGGSALRFGESGAEVSQLKVILFTTSMPTTAAICPPWLSPPVLKDLNVLYRYSVRPEATPFLLPRNFWTASLGSLTALGVI